MRGSVIAIVTLLGMVVPGFGGAQSLAVERSIRPEVRPVTQTRLVEIKAAPSNLGFARWIAGFRDAGWRQGIRAEVFDAPSIRFATTPT